MQAMLRGASELRFKFTRLPDSDSGEIKGNGASVSTTGDVLSDVSSLRAALETLNKKLVSTCLFCCLLSHLHLPLSATVTSHSKPCT